MRSTATLFSPHQSTNRQLVDEIKCFYLHNQLLANLEVVEKYFDTARKNRLSQFLKQFERSLIINTRTQAVQVGESYVIAGCKALCNAIESDQLTDLLQSLGINNSEENIRFDAHYIATEHRLRCMAETPYQAELQDTYTEVLIALAKCKSFTLLKNLLDKLSNEACSTIPSALDTAFFYAMHFGDHEIMRYLLTRGVSPHVINQADPDRKQMPLSLIVVDMYNFVLRMEKRVVDLRKNKLLLGTLQDLESVFTARLNAYHHMITTLIECGANPNQTPDESYIHKDSPRDKAQDYLNTLIPELEKSDFHFKDKAIEITALLELMMQLAPTATLDTYEAAQPYEKKLKL